MLHFYETTHNDGNTFPVVTAHDTIDDAIAFADAHGIETITEYGGSFDEYKKCWFCGEWFSVSDLNDDGTCAPCARAIKDHGG